jgi:hypothetical protein
VTESKQIEALTDVVRDLAAPQSRQVDDSTPDTAPR